MTAPDVNADVRARFEAWYVENAFDYGRNPLGSRECGLQWKAWQAALADLSGEVRELVEALQAARDYGAMTGDEWVVDKVDAALAKHTHQEKNDVLP